MIKHIVMWKFKDGEKENMKKFLEGLNSLKNIIPEIKYMETGININPKNDYDAILISEFETMEDLEKYKQLLLDLNNKVVASAPEDLTINTHVCRGNYHSTYFSSGAYDGVADLLFGEENVDAYFDHGFPIDINELCVTFKKVDYAKSYDVMVSKDNNFKVTKTYTTDKNSLRVKAANDDFITPHWHGRYVKVRANYGYGMHSKWSEPEMVGCGKLHLDQDFDNVPE